MSDKKEVDVKKEVKEKKVVEPKEGKRVLSKEEAQMNELAFRVGDKFELKGFPFKVKEVGGLDVVLRRTDIK